MTKDEVITKENILEVFERRRTYWEHVRKKNLENLNEIGSLFYRKHGIIAEGYSPD